MAAWHTRTGWTCGVCYVGRGAGTGDTGHYQVNSPDGTATLAWQYRVIRLWQMRAEELLAVGRPALLALVGQTQIEMLETVLPDVVARLRSIPDTEMRGKLLAALTALIPEEEIVAMVERLIDREELLLDTPFLRRLREEARQEGRQEGREEGVLAARRRSILDVLVVRFDPPVSVYQQIERQLATIIDEPLLAQLLAAAIRAESVADFQTAMGQEHRTNVSQ
jgi:predicted transposase YdaD